MAKVHVKAIEHRPQRWRPGRLPLQRSGTTFVCKNFGWGSSGASGVHLRSSAPTRGSRPISWRSSWRSSPGVTGASRRAYPRIYATSACVWSTTKSERCTPRLTAEPGLSIRCVRSSEIPPIPHRAAGRRGGHLSVPRRDHIQGRRRNNRCGGPRPRHGLHRDAPKGDGRAPIAGESMSAPALDTSKKTERRTARVGTGSVRAAAALTAVALCAGCPGSPARRPDAAPLARPAEVPADALAESIDNGLVGSWKEVGLAPRDLKTGGPALGVCFTADSEWTLSRPGSRLFRRTCLSCQRSQPAKASFWRSASARARGALLEREAQTRSPDRHGEGWVRSSSR